MLANLLMFFDGSYFFWLCCFSRVVMLFSNSLPCWKKANQESRKLYGWGVAFPSPQNCSKWTFSHNTFNWESCGNFFPVLGWKPMYANTLTWTTSGKKGQTRNQESFMDGGYILQNTFNWESCGNFFPVLGWRPMYANTLTWTTSGKKGKPGIKKALWMGGSLSQPQNCSKWTFHIILLIEKVAVTFFQFWDESPCTQTP